MKPEAPLAARRLRGNTSSSGRVPTLEEFLDYIYPDGVPEEGATLEVDIPDMVRNLTT